MNVFCVFETKQATEITNYSLIGKHQMPQPSAKMRDPSYRKLRPAALKPSKQQKLQTIH